MTAVFFKRVLSLVTLALGALTVSTPLRAASVTTDVDAFTVNYNWGEQDKLVCQDWWGMVWNDERQTSEWGLICSECDCHPEVDYYWYEDLLVIPSTIAGCSYTVTVYSSSGDYDLSYTGNGSTIYDSIYYESNGDSGGYSYVTATQTCDVETWTPFEEPGASGVGTWGPACDGYWEDQTFTQSRENYQWFRVGERSDQGNERNVTNERRVTTETRQTQGCKPLNWRPFEDMVVDWHEVGRSPAASTVWEDTQFNQGVTDERTVRTGERNDRGDERSVNSSTQTRVRTIEAVWGTRPLNWHPFEQVLVDWHEISRAPATSTVWEDTQFSQTATDERMVRTGERNDRGDERNVGTTTPTRIRTIVGVWGTRPLNWHPVEEVTVNWHEVSRTPSAASVWEDTQFNQTATDERTVRTSERDDRGDERNVQTTTSTRARTIEAVWGLRPLNWHFWENRLARDWYDAGDWGPSTASKYFWEDLTQSMLRFQDWAEWAINDRGDSRISRVFSTPGSFNRTVKGTAVPPVGALQFDLPVGVGAVNIGVGTASGTVTLPNGIVVTGNSSGAGSITLPNNVIPGGVTVSASGGQISVTTSSGTSILGAGGSVDLGGGAVVSVSSTGTASVTLPGGASVTVGANGGSIAFPGGVNMRVAVDGRIDIDLPPNTPPLLAKAVNLAGMIYNAGAGHIMSVRDAISLIVGPLPSNPLLDVLDLGITASGVTQIGLRQNNDNATNWVPVFVNRTTTTQVAVEIVSRDKFMAGSIVVPDGSNVEVEFFNTTTRESLGRYGSLLGGGSTKIYNTETDILSDEDVASRNNDLETFATQNVFFVKDDLEASKVNFYTSFSAVGQVEVRVYQGVEKIYTAPHTLVASPDFGNWITYVENWVEGTNLNLPDDPGGMTTAAFTFTPRSQATTGVSSNSRRNLVRASLIPIFNVVSQVIGMDPLLKGLIDGFATGLEDDWKTIKLLGSAYVTVSEWQQAAVLALITSLRDHPLERARMFCNITKAMVAETVLKSMAPVAADLSTWSGFKKRSKQVWKAIEGGQEKQWVIAAEMVIYVSRGIYSWLDDFGARMMANADEITAYQNTMWYTGPVDPMEQEMRSLANVISYSAGYYTGYIGEQFLTGALTAGSVKIAQIFLRAGARAEVIGLAKRSLFAITTRFGALKKTTQGVMAAINLRIAVETALRDAANKPVSAAIKATQAEYIESAFTVAGFRTKFTMQMMMANLAEKPRLRELFEVYHAGGIYFDRASDLSVKMSSVLTGDAAKGWGNLFETLLPLKPNDLDRAPQWFNIFPSTNVASRIAQRETLEALASKTPEQILADGGVKLSPKMPLIYKEMYTYMDASTLLNHATEPTSASPLWLLDDFTTGGQRFVSPVDVPAGPTAKATARDYFQLPQLGTDNATKAYTRGLFKGRMANSEFANDLTVPISRRHGDGSDFIPQAWLEPLALDNPERGLGGKPQFTQKKSVYVSVINNETGEVITSKAQLRAYLQSLGLTPP